ncbi:MAG: glutamate mutase L, partial [Chloroflexi bacterium]|nr:glutamate mutase L [Chloroflexota bacterium]
MEELRDSYLLADIGHVTSRVALLDRVADEYRFIARGEALSTLEPPWEDVALGLREAVVDIQETTQRPLLNPQGTLLIPEDDDGQGVDGFLVTTSAMRPLRVVLVGLMGSWSLERAQRVVHSTYATVERVFDIESWRLGGGEELAWLAQALSSDRLDALLLVGGTEGGAVAPIVEIAKDLALLILTYRGQREPRVIYAGNSEARPLVAQVLGKVADLRVVENVLPSFEMENYLAAREALDQLLLEAQLPTLPGIRALVEAWGLAPVYPAAQTLGWSISYLARQYGLDILGVDLGASGITLVSAQGEEPPRIVTRANGLGRGLEGFLSRLGMDRIRRWLPEEVPAEEVERLALSKALHPRMLPQEWENLLIER